MLEKCIERRSTSSTPAMIIGYIVSGGSQQGLRWVIVHLQVAFGHTRLDRCRDLLFNLQPSEEPRALRIPLLA